MDAERVSQAVRATAASFERVLTTLRRATGTLERVIAENEKLAKMPGHEASARRRIREARAEIRAIRRQTAEVERRIEESHARDPSLDGSVETKSGQGPETTPDDAVPGRNESNDADPT